MILPLTLPITNCAGGDGAEQLGPLREVVAGLAAHDASAASSVRPVTINGLAGAQVDLGWSPESKSEAACARTAASPYSRDWRGP